MEQSNEIMQAVLLFSSLLAVFVLALVQLVKISLNIPKRAVPVIGVLIGLLIGIVSYPFTDLELILRLWAGGIAGLSATGLFEFAFNKQIGSTKD